MTATLPLPFFARGLSVVMAENELLIWLRESFGAAVLLPLPEEPDDELLPQAAMRRAALPAMAVNATFLETGCNGTTSLWAGTCRGGRASGVPPGRAPPSIWGNTRPTGINRAVNICVTP